WSPDFPLSTQPGRAATRPSGNGDVVRCTASVQPGHARAHRGACSWVLGSWLRHAPERRQKRSSNNGRIEIAPLRVLRFDESGLPIRPPFLELLFARDRTCGLVISLE